MKKIMSFILSTVIAMGGALSLVSCGCEHSWTKTSDTATCTSSGVATYTCNKCGNTKTEDSSAKGHNWSLTSTTATCESSGTATYTCANCKQTKTESASAKGHDYSKSDNCWNCGKYKYNIVITNAIPCAVSYNFPGGNGSYSKATISLLEFNTNKSSGNKVEVYGKAKKTYDWKGEAGTSAVAFKIKIVCTTDDEVLGIIQVYETNAAVGQTITFDEISDIHTYDLSTSKEYKATIFDY